MHNATPSRRFMGVAEDKKKQEISCLLHLQRTSITWVQSKLTDTCSYSLLLVGMLYNVMFDLRDYPLRLKYWDSRNLSFSNLKM